MRVDALVIGGGFYGCCLAIHLRRRFERILVVEAAERLLTRASFGNQARLHNGYHYPRSFLTAARSRKNLDAFRREFPSGVFSDFRHLYAIARGESKVGHRHFERFAQAIGARLARASEAQASLFTPRLIEAVYEVEEPAFDADALRIHLARRMEETGVTVRMGAEVTSLRSVGGEVRARFADGDEIAADWAFNCTYSGLNRIVPKTPTMPPGLVHQVTEIALVEPPDALRRLAVTVMDGPFFSTMPFPAENLHSLSHVRYTPHMTWTEANEPELDPYGFLRGPPPETRFPWMVRDARRYFPLIDEVRYVRSIFEIKTLVDGTQSDDARPILFHRDPAAPRIVSILGSKIDNIFDVYDVVDEALEAA